MLSQKTLPCTKSSCDSKLKRWDTAGVTAQGVASSAGVASAGAPRMTWWGGLIIGVVVLLVLLAAVLAALPPQKALAAATTG